MEDIVTKSIATVEGNGELASLQILPLITIKFTLFRLSMFSVYSKKIHSTIGRPPPGYRILRKTSCLSFQDEFQEEVGWLDNHHQISLPGIPITRAENPNLLLSAVSKFHNKAIPVIWKLCAAWRCCYSQKIDQAVSKTNTFSMGHSVQ